MSLSAVPGWGLAAPYLTSYVRYRLEGWRGADAREDAGAMEAFYRRMWTEAAEEVGAELADLGYGFFELRAGGRVTRVHQTQVMLDHPVILRLTATKPLAMKLIADAGIPVPPHCVYDLATLDAARAFVRAASGPFVVKPARESGAGDGVTTGVETDRELVRASIRASFFRRELLIERQIPGTSCRLLYLDGELIDAIRRQPPRVTGDGRSSVRDLVRSENRRRAAARGGAAVRRIRMDLDCLSTLRRSGLSPRTVPAAGALVQVKTAVNDNSAEDNEPVLPLVGRPVVEAGARAAAAVGVRLAGVDLIASDLGVSLEESGGVIHEVNGAPGLHHHYNVRSPGGTRVASAVLRRLLGIGEPAAGGSDRIGRA